ncbi:hypothetical protein BDU57DRAFT_509900 [Ampelomyces quisqualis]|uniref:Uncharacterized protein n=1 Tax=Ampelomyces quisqualis TaxID=50730 RepID=A0A6A5R0L2_AMPQU|nr:hypothetical protein BDU57DRAFT_509900 [Ampelomyces quisqualis]
MQQQIHELYEQVKMLRLALENTANSLPASLHAHSTTPPPPPPPAMQPGRGTARRLSDNRSSPAYILQKARRRFGRSTTELVEAAHELDKVMPTTGASIVDLIHHRLLFIGRQALREGDPALFARLKKYRRFHVLGLGSEKAIVRVAAILKRAKIMYLQSISLLAEALRSVESMESAPVSHISALIRDRLVLIAHTAVAERDTNTLQSLVNRRIFRQILSDLPSDERPSLSFTAEYESERPRNKSMTPPASQRLHNGVRPSSLGHRDPNRNTLDRSKRVPMSEPSSGRTDPTKEPNIKSKVRHVGERGQVPEHAQDVYARSSMTPVDHANLVTPDMMKRKQLQETSDTKPTSAPPDGPDNARSSPTKKPKSGSKAPSQDPKAKSSTTGVTNPASAAARVDASGKQSLLEELFPEANPSPTTRLPEDRGQYPKLDPPENTKLISRQLVDRPLSKKEQLVKSFQKSGEKITALQLVHCSTELTEFDFRRLIPKAKHSGVWTGDGAFYKIIPGRDPLSLERLPFYYLLFKSPESAHAYQKNAGRLHKLAALHQPSNIFSAIPAPKGFLEDGEDLEAATSSYLLKPTEHALELRTLMQPYHPALRTLFEQEGYKPVVPNLDNKGNRIFKVLMHIEGYEPTPADLFKTLRTDAYLRGTSIPLCNESDSSIHRLRDLINLKTRTLPIANTRPRQYGRVERESSTSSDFKVEFEDPTLAYLMQGDGTIEADDAKGISQEVMSRAYNRWILDFDDQDEARRFALTWHRRELVKKTDKNWKDFQQVRMCNCELLW